MTHQSLVPWRLHSSNLTNLLFSLSWTHAVVPLEALTTVLKECVHLRALNLDLSGVHIAVKDEDTSAALSDPRHIIEFPELRKLSIWAPHDHSFMRLLERLIFPRSFIEARLILIHGHEQDSLPLARSVFRDILETSETAKIDASLAGVTLHAGPSLNLTIKWREAVDMHHLEPEEGCKPGCRNLGES